MAYVSKKQKIFYYTKTNVPFKLKNLHQWEQQGWLFLYKKKTFRVNWKKNITGPKFFITKSHRRKCPFWIKKACSLQNCIDVLNQTRNNLSKLFIVCVVKITWLTSFFQRCSFVLNGTKMEIIWYGFLV